MCIYETSKGEDSVRVGSEKHMEGLWLQVRVMVRVNDISVGNTSHLLVSSIQ